eukprot:317830-Pyramimonas_sp.AAC.1
MTMTTTEDSKRQREKDIEECPGDPIGPPRGFPAPRGAVLRPLEGLLGASWVLLRASGVSLGRLGASLRRSEPPGARGPGGARRKTLRDMA